MRSSIEEHFSQLEDPRVERNQFHGFVGILILVICAVTSSAEGWEAIERFGKAKLRWLRQFAPFANGIPSHDCIANVIQGGEYVLGLKGNQSALHEAVTGNAPLLDH